MILSEADKKKYTVLALLTYIADRAVISIINSYKETLTQSTRYLCYNIATVVFLWATPILIVTMIERRGASSLGLSVPKNRRQAYLALAGVCLIAPGVFLGFTEFIPVLIEQLLFIGLVEEFFYRGYLMTRICEWKGQTFGLLLNSILFSLAHISFIITNEGLKYPWFIASTGVQTFIGGALLGYIFLREGNIVPCAIIHISMNLYLFRILG